MRLTLAATALAATALLAATAQAQVANTGRRMPLPGQTGAAGTAAGSPATTPAPTFTEAQQREATLKAQRASQARDKAWDDKMKRTMSSICHGC